MRFRVKKISTPAEKDDYTIQELSQEQSNHYTNKDAVLADDENSQHSFGSSAVLEMKKQVNDFFQHCNSDMSFTGKYESDVDKMSNSDERQ